MNMKKIKNLGVYLLGLFILAIGVIFSINADLGISPVNATPYVFSLTLGISVGNGVILFFLALIALQWIMLRKEFKLSSLLQIVVSFVFGFFVDAANFLIGDFAFFPEFYAGQLLTLAVSIILIALGLVLYVETKIVPMPSEGVLLALLKKFPKFSLGTMKIIFDIGVVIIAIIFSLIFLSGIYGIREGTIVTAFLIGKMMAIISRLLRKRKQTK
ncbi:MAG: DUF6198 family protein [Defluviitaleaceae bacterium]|nr:DUF6198 family protein [Defluviitaleaceae bacterium]